MLDAAARVLGGYRRWAGVDAATRRDAMRAVAVARWAQSTLEERALARAHMARGWATRVPMTPAPPLPARVTPQLCHWPTSCVRCGSSDAVPYLTDAGRPFAGWTWRCRRHAFAPAEGISG